MRRSGDSGASDSVRGMHVSFTLGPSQPIGHLSWTGYSDHILAVILRRDRGSLSIPYDVR